MSGHDAALELSYRETKEYFQSAEAQKIMQRIAVAWRERTRIDLAQSRIIMENAYVPCLSAQDFLASNTSLHSNVVKPVISRNDYRNLMENTMRLIHQMSAADFK